MAVQFTVTADSTAYQFNTLNTAEVTRFFLDFIPSGLQMDNKRFRMPGWDSNGLIRGGFTGQQLTLITRYRGTLAAITAAWKNDMQVFANYNCILTDGVTTWSRCTLRSDGSTRITEELAYGPGGVKFFDVRYVFDAEELY